MEPENLRGINAVNTRQRIVAVLIAVDVGERHISMHFLQQTESFPDKPGGDWLAGWLSAHHLASRFADASPERIVAEADLRLWPVAIPRLADHFRQAMFAVVAVVPAGLAVILLHGAAMDVITPANAVELRQTVVRDFLSSPLKRVTGRIPAPLLLAGQRTVLNQRRGGGRWALSVKTSRRCSRPRRSYSLRVVSSPGSAVLTVEFVAGILTACREQVNKAGRKLTNACQRE